MDELAQALRGIVDADDDLGRTPAELGITVTSESEQAAGTVHGGSDEHGWIVQLDPVLLALPLPRTFLLAAASAGLIDVILPPEAPEAMGDLLFEQAGLTLDQATIVVDLTIGLLDEHLHVYASDDAGLASSGHALAHADRVIAGASDTNAIALATAVWLTIGTFEELDSAQELADHLGPIGLAETAALVAAVDAR